MSTLINNEFDSTDSNAGQSLTYLEDSLQQIFDEMQTLDGLILWAFVVVAITLGLIFNGLVLRSICRIKCNGKSAVIAPGELYHSKSSSA